MRTVLPILAHATVPDTPNADWLSLQCFFANFSGRMGDRFEEEAYFSVVIDAMDQLGCCDSPNGTYLDVLPAWGTCVRIAEVKHVERYRLLNQIFECWTSINAFLFKSEEENQVFHSRMLASVECVAKLRDFERKVIDEDTAFLASQSDGQSSEVYKPARFHPQSKMYRQFNAVMAASEGEQPAESSQADLLAFCGDENVALTMRARGLNRLANISLNAGDVIEARRRFQSSGSLARGQRAEDVRLEAWKGICITYFLEENFKEASKVASVAIANVENMRSSATTPYLSSAFMVDKFEIYALGIETARRLGEFSLMFARMDMMKARSVQVAPGSIPKSIRGRTLKELASLRKTIAGEASRSIHRKRVRDQRQQLWQAMMLKRTPAPANLNMADLQSVLGLDTIIINYFFLGENALLVSALSTSESVTERIELPNDTPLYDALVRFESASPGSLGFPGLLRKVARVLLPPSFDRFLENARQAIFCPHQRLHSLPFSALPWRDTPLILQMEVGCIPNLTCLTLSPDEEQTSGLFALATEFATEMDKHPLPCAEPEAAQAAQIWQDTGQLSTLLLGQDASLDRLLEPTNLERLASARVVHFGLHGSDVADQHAVHTPMDAHLFCHDARLDGMELSTLNINADVVILALCHGNKRAVAARGLKRLPSDEVYGLQAALHTAGAKSTLGALWVVDDETTAKFTRSLHTELAHGKTPAAAFRKSVITHLENAGVIERDPSFWAAYNLIAFGRSAFGLKQVVTE